MFPKARSCFLKESFETLGEWLGSSPWPKDLDKWVQARKNEKERLHLRL